MRKKAGGRDKEGGGGTRRGGSRVSSQRPSRSHSDEEEDEGVPASYHTVSLQVSQDVSTTAVSTFLPLMMEAQLLVSGWGGGGLASLSRSKMIDSKQLSAQWLGKQSFW